MTSAFRSVSTYIALTIGLVGLAVILYAWQLPPFRSSIETTENAYVRGQVTLIAPQLAGYVAEVPVQDFAAVKQGDLLLRIDDRIYAQKLEQARAGLAAQRAALANSDQARAAAERATPASDEPDVTHSQVQGWLRDLGLALGFGVWIASNDRNRPYDRGRLADGCATALPPAVAASEAADTIGLIDVLWLDPDGERVAAAFEVEHTTSIYSGILRMRDLAESTEAGGVGAMYLVAPESQEDDVRAQLRRPAFRRVGDLGVRYLPYGELERHRDSAARFGRGLHPVEQLSRSLV